jgi:hypothetical protein
VARKKAAENRVARLKSFLFAFMLARGIKKLEGETRPEFCYCELAWLDFGKHSYTPQCAHDAVQGRGIRARRGG